MHELHGKTDDPDAEVWAGQQFAYAYDDAELSALVACLKAWVDRDDIWGKSTHLMLESISLHREISSNRLMAACKWFEEIPNTNAIPAIQKKDISVIASVAADRASQLGYTDLLRRITGSIKAISKETNSDRMSRLTNDVCVIFGHDLFDGEFTKNLTMATGLRGKVAHGYFEPESDDEFSCFAKSIYALEALCYLLTIKDLPILDAGKERIKYMPFVSNYRTAY
ncbi:hypothetical+protein [Methylocapsa aurea]|uniref:hypothetical protein n=1 Tax=Methylocapsa aurea TaxID=663610 RepID=UPI003D1898D7